MAKDKAEPDKPKERLKPALLFLRDAGIAMAFVASILLAMYAYTGLWPPLVVVESDSMMHSDDNISYLGAIDTGDLVLVKDVDSVGDIETYMEGVSSRHKTYGDFGDVVIYKKYGSDAYTPIIHRAMVYLEWNPDTDGYMCEALQRAPSDKWSTSDPDDTWDHLTSTLTITNVGYRSQSVYIDIGRIISDYRGTTPGDGFVTKGDHNIAIDQSQGGTLGSRPVDITWVVGKARGEIPWFGLLKLWFTDSLASEAPANSVRNLYISLALIIVAPIAADVLLTYRIRKKIAKRRAQAEEELRKEKELAAKAAPVAPDSPVPGEPPKTA